MKITISIIYVYYNTPQEITDSINSIKKNIGKISYEIIVIDNASSKPFPKKLRTKKIIFIKNKTNKGFGAAVNIAAKKAKGEFLLILNPDTIVKKNAINYLYKKIVSDKKIGIISPQFLDQDNNISPSISKDPQGSYALFSFSILNRIFPNNYFSNIFWLKKINRNKEQVVDVVGGACLMMRKKLFDEIAGFDTRFFMYFEESDICLRVRKSGYKIVYYPKAKIIHFIGRSSANKELIEKIFEKSRLRYLQKYHGVLLGSILELVIRFLQPVGISLFFILCICGFLNLYKISTLMMFFGDFGRDYLAARDMVLTHKIPLVGISSSVPWLHQGPLSIYFIGCAFILGNFAPYAPAIFYSVIGVCSTYLIYILGKIFFTKQVGIFSALFYATSPLVIISTRMPYHTSSIPFFAMLFFLTIYKILQENKKLFPLALFLLGLLFLLEISNGVLIFILFLLYIFYRTKVTKKEIIFGFVAFIIGVLPFILYNFAHNFSQSNKLILAVNRHIAELFIHQNTGSAVFYTLGIIWEQIVRILFPNTHIVAVVFVALFVVTTIFKRKELFFNKGFIITILWLFIPLIIYILRESPSTAYFPLIFPAVAIFVGITINFLFQKNKLFFIPFLLITFWNGFYTINNNYFLNSADKIGYKAQGWNYGLGTSLEQQQKQVKAIITDANSAPLTVKGEGVGFLFPSDIDNYIYLVWYDKGNLAKNAKNKYIIYQNETSHSKHDKVIYKDEFVTIVKE